MKYLSEWAVVIFPQLIARILASLFLDISLTFNALSPLIYGLELNIAPANCPVSFI
jgi:hypothetical protein